MWLTQIDLGVFQTSRKDWASLQNDIVSLNLWPMSPYFTDRNRSKLAQSEAPTQMKCTQLR